MDTSLSISRPCPHRHLLIAPFSQYLPTAGKEQDVGLVRGHLHYLIANGLLDKLGYEVVVRVPEPQMFCLIPAPILHVPIKSNGEAEG